MKKITYLLLIVCCFNFAQTEDAYQSTLGKVTDAFNSNNADTLFGLFSSELQAEFSLEKVKTFISDNQKNRGSMGAYSLIMGDDSLKQYLIEFDETSVIMNIGLAPNNKISKLELEDY